ncbi:hypothetical protein CDD83_5730 [Cordyceps sp. RAO-2017]|nr:hypothetical protein CDD83_5730 [Cordyceps sp. RAO-2017]
MTDELGSSWAQPRVWSRAVNNNATSSGLGGFMFQSSTAAAMSNETKFATEKSLRTSFIVLASVNAVAGAVTASVIFSDCYFGAKRRDPGLTLRTSYWTVIGPRETLPFILSLGIVAQGIIFAVAQSHGLGAVLISGCPPVSQMTLPALFIVPFIQLVFGLETTARALRRQPFPAAPRWTLLVCLGLVLAGLIISYAATRLSLPPDICFAELLWLVRQWSAGIIGVLAFIACSLLVGSVIILVRLYKSSGIPGSQRTAASWTACYMLLAPVTTVMMVPFFWSVNGEDARMIMRYQMRLAMAATIVANLSGLLTGGLYLLLRVTKLGKLGRRGYFEFDRQKPAIGPRAMTPSNLIYTKQLEQPISPVRLERMMRKNADRTEEIKYEEKALSSPPVSPMTRPARPPSPGTARRVPPILTPGPPDSAYPLAGTMRRPSARKDSYNLFPPPRHEAPDTKSTYLLPAAAHNPAAAAAAAAAPGRGGDGSQDVSPDMEDVLLPPQAVWTTRRQRNSSMESSATVQIALRVSNINDMPPVTSPYQGPPYPDHAEDPRTFGLAITTDASPFADPKPRYTMGSQYIDEAVFDSDDEESDDLPPLFPASRAGDGKEATKTKKADDDDDDDDAVTLSPTVYCPTEAQPSATAKPRDKSAHDSPSAGTPQPPAPVWTGDCSRAVPSGFWF